MCSRKSSIDFLAFFAVLVVSANAIVAFRFVAVLEHSRIGSDTLIRSLPRSKSS